MKVPLSQQIAEVRREIGKRRTVYARLVSKGSMRKGEADHAIAVMEAVQATLEWLQTNETEIRKAVAERKGATP